MERLKEKDTRTDEKNRQTIKLKEIDKQTDLKRQTNGQTLRDRQSYRHKEIDKRSDLTRQINEQT